MHRLRARHLLVALALAGCGASGPEVRTTSDPAEWTPTRMLVLPPAGGSGAIPPGTVFPEGVTATTLPEAIAATASALVEGLRLSATGCQSAAAEPFSRTDTAGLLETVNKQYLDTRTIDPAAARALGEALGADAYWLTAILRYGPEVDGDAQQVTKGVGTSVKTTDVGINVASSYIIVYYNAQIRTALVRSSDGAIMWDAASRQRERRGALRTVTQASVLRAAVDTLMQGFPWRGVEPETPDH